MLPAFPSSGILGLCACVERVATSPFLGASPPWIADRQPICFQASRETSIRVDRFQKSHTLGDPRGVEVTKDLGLRV